MWLVLVVVVRGVASFSCYYCGGSGGGGGIKIVVISLYNI